MIAVCALRAERDRMVADNAILLERIKNQKDFIVDLREKNHALAAELDRTKAALLIAEQRATNAIKRTNAVNPLRSSDDLAELVRLAESVDTIVNERRYIDPLFVDQSRLILRLAQAVAGKGGGK